MILAFEMQFPVPGSKAIVHCVDNIIYLWDLINKSAICKYTLPSTPKADCHCDVTSCGNFLLCVRIWFRLHMPELQSHNANSSLLILYFRREMRMGMAIYWIQPRGRNLLEFLLSE